MLVQKECDPVEALARGTVRFMNQDSAERRVFDLQQRGLSVFHFKVMRGIIQLKAIASLDLHCIVSSLITSSRAIASSIFSWGAGSLM